MITHVCLNCVNTFETYPSGKKFRATLYCSRKCYFSHRYGSPEQRFEKQINRTDYCWLWTGELNKYGYGRFWINGHNIPATHFSLKLFRSEIVPKGMMACHTCDNPPCVNPDHLFISTHQGNIDDAVSKNRMSRKTRANLHLIGDNHWTRQHPERRLYGDKNPTRLHPETRPRGENHAGTTLTRALVDELRGLHATGEWTFNALAARFDVSNVTAANVVKQKVWKDAYHPLSSKG